MHLYDPAETNSQIVQSYTDTLKMPRTRRGLFEHLVRLANTTVKKGINFEDYYGKRKRFDLRIFRTKKDFSECSLCQATKNIHRHHIIPLSKNGINAKHNLIAFCSYCHKCVHTNTLPDYLEFKPKTIRRPGIICKEHFLVSQDLAHLENN